MYSKFKIFICLLSVVYAFDSRRCMLYRGMCVAHCPRYMHPYHTRCNGQTTSQRTCDEPDIYILGYTCGWSRCDCNDNLLLDERSGTCVTADICMDIPERLRRKLDRMRESKRGRKLRMSKRIKIIEDELTQLT